MGRSGEKCDRLVVDDGHEMVEIVGEDLQFIR